MVEMCNEKCIQSLFIEYIEQSKPMVDPIEKAATGLAIIIPAIFLLRWFLTRKTGSPEEWMEERIKELEQKLALGEIDQETYDKRLRDMRDS